MGQNASAQRQGRDEERLARLRTERSQRDCLDERNPRGREGPSRSRRHAWVPGSIGRMRRDDLHRPATAEGFVNTSTSTNEQQYERAPTPFDTGDMLPDGPIPNGSSNSDSGMSGILRRGRRWISPHSRASTTTENETPSGNHSLGHHNSSSQAWRRSRNRLSTIFSSPEESGFLNRGGRNRASVSRPLGELPDDWTWDDQPTASLHEGPDEPPSAPGSRSRRSRFSRVRNSLLPPVPPFLQRTPNQESRSESGSESRSSWRRSSRLDFNPTPTRGLDMNPPLSFPERGTMNPPGSGQLELNGRPRIERPSRRTPMQQDPSRNQRGEDQAARLSRHLSVAATAIAASLVGNTERAFSEAHDVASDGISVDGSFDNFLQALQNGSLATALRNGNADAHGDTGTVAAEGILSPVNFFRIFRFGNSNNQDNRSASATSAEQEAETSPRGSTGEQTGRMVPVIIVGIRSVTPRPSTLQDDGNMTSPLFDALTNLPLIMPPGLSTRGTGTLLRRTDRRSRFSRHRRASMSAVNSFPANYDSQRHHRLGSGASRPGMESSPLASSSTPTETPPGPHPPPSTPAEHGLSAGSSGNNTPLRRPSTASGGLALSSLNVGARPTGALEPSIEETSDPRPGARRRRLSDGEFARYRDFGPGSSRRHGIVGDSEVDTPTTPLGGGQPEGPRTWIVYVLGGSYPEDHPILTTPSLFTDSPTYEDMLLLSSILGPAKPPVASREEVASAPGIYRIIEDSQPTRIAISITGDRVTIEADERCLICLCDYELQEEVRQLNNCRHMFHRECIDEWLTTGRNSCPLCRGQGVGKADSDSPPDTRTDDTPPSDTINTS
ncbi:MAG: hypothetical protein M1816_000130 [Peltula sp. TS41687]|nr:MAG: hypothetical protein M1816_000130 [Peltula sp. TS41687]